MVFERYFRDYIHEFNQLDRKNWNYEDGCVLIGMQALYEATGEDLYFTSIQNFIDRYVGEDGSIEYYDILEFNIDRIPSGRVFYLLYEKTGKEKYRKAIELLMKQLRSHPRTDCGNFWHKKIYPYQIWLDGLYMGMPYYLLYETKFDQGQYYEEIIKQFKNTRKYLFNEESGLYYHAYDEKKEMFWADPATGLSPNYWSRSIGWYLMALADCYEIFPEEELQYRKFLGQLLKEAVDGILRYQDPESGLFYQLPALGEEPGNYLETSASAMIAYTLLKGVRLGILEENPYRGIGEAILIALETRMFVLAQGELKLTGMCKGAGLGPADNPKRDGSVSYYLSEEVVSDEQKGVGVGMAAYSEWLKLKQKNCLQTLGFPKVAIYNRGYE
ncbi:MAG: glycoside hydrolase family 88 protein [Hungatella sp.]